jgi:hypothetical protein
VKTIIRTMEDQQLFGQSFKRRLLRGDTFARWKVFLRALFALPMTEADQAIYREHTGRSDTPAEPFHEAFCIVGRRGGKSLISALIGVYLATFKTYDDVLAPGEVGTLMVIAADRRQARVIFGYVIALLESSPMLRSMVTSKLKESVELGRIRIEIHTCSFKATRGYTLIGVIADELAFWNSDASANPDTEVLAALRPGLATTNGLLLGISSPYGKKGALFQAYASNYGKPTSVLVWKATSREMNPTLSAATVAMAYVRDTASARAEYGGEFRDDIAAFVPREVVEARVIPGRFELARETGFNYVGFTDPSGGSSDSFTLSIAQSEQGTVVLDCIREVVPPFSPEQVVSEFAEVLKSYGVSKVTGDAYAGLWPRERFQKCGIQYEVSPPVRAELYLSFLPMLMSGRVELLDNARLVNQLVNLERRTARSGKDSVDHAPGSHDDIANAVAGALVEALGGAAELGLIEWFKGLAAGVFKQEQQPTQSEDPFGKRATLAFELKLQGLLKPLGSPEEVISPCPRCQGPRILVGGCGIRCSQCGAVYSNQNDREPLSVPATEGPCCSSPLPQRIAGGGVRCGNCGRQSNIAAHAGVSRDAAISGTWSGGRAKMNSGAFRQAFARLLFGGKTGHGK